MNYLTYFSRFNNNWDGVEGLEPFIIEQLAIAFGFLMGGSVLGLLAFIREVYTKRKEISKLPE